MSDFLSRFNKDNYDKLQDEKQEKEIKSETDNAEKVDESAPTDEIASSSEVTPVKGNQSPAPSSRRSESVEELEIDPEYQKKKRRRIIYSIIGSIAALLLIFVIYYQVVHVTMEDFVGESVQEARSWANENGIEIEVKHETSMEHDANHVITQSVPAGKNVRKGKTIQLVSSSGPDPEEQIELPEFKELSQYEAETWIADNKVENLQLISEYSDDIEQGEFIRFEIRDSAIDESEYRRKDRAIVYYSRGQEVFEKNITVPNFTGKTMDEVEQWAKTNEIALKVEEEDSNNVEVGLVISQSVSPDEKVAKRDEMEVVVSLGKATVVPNFGELTMEEASSYPGLAPIVKQKFHASVSYGGLISQSIEAGTRLTDQEETNLTVVYSEGQPYLRDYRGQLEGDLPRLFYEDYQSKGANIRYKVKYVSAPEVKGTVVSMSKFNEFVPMTYTVVIGVSNNTNAPASPWENDGGTSEPPPEEVEVEK
ncbi:PASTA domain-containing protein [Alkalihalobacillus sp. LMS39]|uniref:PASTA domain-containing protein n=1 Tax=Alkalihalobacillus sp. LMS39 TaxID=2924032 RepID=UPI001FB235AC|nr:PASTA domain-containing protein [Alkalihalobacillus sp. LMS39]UOE94066.1 PASTA domain-containing protein [Alkalihalobacillus sp. LMS39]